MGFSPGTAQFCDRCLKSLTLGQGDWYLITIQAVADPTPPPIRPEPQAAAETRRQIEQLLDTLSAASSQELQDQVTRRLNLTLCRACYERWIEDPTGRTGPAHDVL